MTNGASLRYDFERFADNACTESAKLTFKTQLV